MVLFDDMMLLFDDNITKRQRLAERLQVIVLPCAMHCIAVDRTRSNCVIPDAGQSAMHRHFNVLIANKEAIPLRAEGLETPGERAQA
jgi:hypothetical protein